MYNPEFEIRETSSEPVFSREDLDRVVTERLKEMQEIITANIEERIQDLLPLHESAKSEDINNLSVTAKMLIQKAKSNDDYVLAAALIYSNIEESLIYEHKLEHQDKRFVIDYSEYLQIADSTKIGERFLLKRFNSEMGDYEILSPRIIEFDSNGIPAKVEMLPIIRFIKAGLTAFEAKQASDYWTVLNKIRHKSPDNELYLKKHFEDLGVPKREYLMQALSFFKTCGLYTKE